MMKKLFPILITVVITVCVCVVLVGGALLYPGFRADMALRPVYQVSNTFMTNLKLNRYEDARIFLSDELAAQVQQPDDVLRLLGLEKEVQEYKRGATWQNTVYNFSRVEIAYSVTYEDGSRDLLILALEKPGEYWKIVSGLVKEVDQ